MDAAEHAGLEYFCYHDVEKPIAAPTINKERPIPGRAKQKDKQ